MKKIKSKGLDYFFKIYEKSNLHGKDFFSKMNLVEMQDDVANRLIEIIECHDEVKEWEKNLVIRIKDEKGFI